MSRQPVNRRLAIIVALDVVGYSARTEADDIAAIDEVVALRGIIETVAAHGSGRIFNTAGDGFMLEFGSALAAVEAARELTEKCRPPVRIGVHMGDVIVQPNGDLLGHGVNVAARLMSVSPPGSALVSIDVKRMIRGPMLERLVPCGSLRLEKMAEEIEAFSLGSVLEPAVPAQPQAPLLVVLPFDNPSGSDDLALVSDGVAEEILLLLTRARGFRVVGRTSAFQFRGKKKSDAARVLKATHVLDGSVRRIGQLMRVSAELCEAVSGAVLWGERFEFEGADILTVQDSIARSVSEALHYVMTLRPRAGRVDPGAYENFLRARELLRRQTNESTREAVILLDAATRAAPEHAPTWAALASAFAARLAFEPLSGETQLAESARKAASKSIAIDPHIGEAYAVQAAVMPDFDRWSEKQEILELGATADPNDVPLLMRRALFKISVGFLRSSYEDSALAFRLDPLSPQAHRGQAIALWLAGRIEQADALFREGRARWPEDTWMWFYHYWAWLNSEPSDEAWRILRDQRPASIAQDFVERQLEIADVLQDAGKANSVRWMEDVTSASTDKFKPYALQAAQVLARLGRPDDAYKIVDRVLQPPWRAVLWGPAPFRVQPGAGTVTLFAPTSRWLRSDPRFAALCARLGLVAFWRGLRQAPDCAAEVADHYNFDEECAKAVHDVSA